MVSTGAFSYYKYGFLGIFLRIRLDRGLVDLEYRGFDAHPFVFANECGRFRLLLGGPFVPRCDVFWDCAAPWVFCPVGGEEVFIALFF